MTLIKHLRSKRLHVICWSIFIFYEVGVTSILSGHYSPLLNYLLFYAINITLFYVHADYILPCALRGKVNTIWLLPPFLLCELAIYCLLIVLAEKLLDFRQIVSAPITQKTIVATVWRGIYFMLYGSGYYFLINYINNENRLHQEEIEVERLNNKLLATQNDFLRAQVNPHLLFNTLNFIKYAAKKRPQDVEAAILSLSEIMSFSLEENNFDFTLLSNELKQIDNIIALNQLRYENRLFLNYNTAVSDSGIRIIPIVLLTLIENVFKHGNLSVSASPAEVRITATKTSLHFYSANLPSAPSSTTGRKAQTGLKNIESRLHSYYAGRHQLSYGMSGKLFTVNLSITFCQEKIA